MYTEFYSNKLKLPESSRLVFNRFFLESVISLSNVSSVCLILIMHLLRPSPEDGHAGDDVLAKTTVDVENVLRKQSKLVFITKQKYSSGCIKKPFGTLWQPLKACNNILL